MANPQNENGFTRIANEILEEVPIRKFNASQLKMIMVIWRYTYGFQRLSHDFSLNFLVEKTGLSKDTVKRELKNLTNKHVLRIVKEASFNQPRQLAFNKNYEEWEVPKNDISPQGEEHDTGGENEPCTEGGFAPSTGGNSSPSTGGESAPQLKKVFKENIKENKKERSPRRKSRFYDEESVHYQLALRLYKNILENNPEHKKPDLQKWADDVRLMMERDKRTKEQIEYLIDWVQKDSFWKSNILSISKLREKFDQLVMRVKEQINRQGNDDYKSKAMPKAYQSLQDWAEGL